MVQFFNLQINHVSVIANIPINPRTVGNNYSIVQPPIFLMPSLENDREIELPISLVRLFSRFKTSDSFRWARSSSFRAISCVESRFKNEQRRRHTGYISKPHHQFRAYTVCQRAHEWNHSRSYDASALLLYPLQWEESFEVQIVFPDLHIISTSIQHLPIQTKPPRERSPKDANMAAIPVRSFPDV